ncbi:zinc finger MYM-type protein 1-like [Xenia sp. Carnegie-2017]|uniref:zinc finger MYM-type protein 1-like n=1 Tax=Xenia sp. Carnegie-2017 TaxID=2897299 RepID=UPI001F033C05|nr:zinc finger MYM-type protein 1-like [Xenia sp. Carnegie-2017]
MEGVEQNQSTISFSPFDGQDIVAELVERSFSSRNISEQKQIARMSRPIPKLTLKTNDRSFQESWYSNKDWLCGSVRKNRLFCWPCLLFHSSPRKSPWASTGYHNMHSFSGDSIKHEKTKSHMEAYKQWRLFDSRESVDVLFSRARREAVERHNEEVRQNRDAKNIGEAVLYLAKQELAFRGHDESRASLNQGNYRELLKCFGKLDSVFDRRLQGRLQGTERVDEGGVFTGVSADVQNDLIECIDSVIQDEIDDEMKECQFFSIQVDETTDVTAKAQLSAIIRLDKGSEIVERFLKFRNVSTDRSAQGISDIVKGILERYGEDN